MDIIVSATPEACDPEPLSALTAPPPGATLVELRIDLFPDLDVAAAVSACPLPVLATYRSEREGGRGSADPEIRRRTLEAARDAGVALVDLEHATDLPIRRLLGLAPEQLVLSWHPTASDRSEVEARCAGMLAESARWVKVVPAAARLADVAAVLSLHRRFNTGPRGQRRLVTFATGTVGLPSRYLSPLLGPPITYAAFSDAGPAALGQQLPGRLLAAVGHLEGPPQRLYGVVGGDVSASLSPALHGAGYRAEKLPYVMLPISVSDEEDLDELFAVRGETVFDRVGLPAWGWAVTAPYKLRAAAAASLAAPRVERAGAANTLLLSPERIVAENTDADGVTGALVTLGVDPAGLEAVVLGTGGAARGAAVGLDLAGAEVILTGRDAARVRAVAEEIGVESGDGNGQPVADAAILVNATPLGSSADDDPPFARDRVEAAAAVVDMVYAEHETTLVRWARIAGVPVADGRDVLAHQGYAQFAAFTGVLPPRELMRRALGRALQLT